MRRLLLFLLPLLSPAQPVVSPTPEPAGSVLGERLGNYSVTNSWELGYRFRTVDGSLDKYRSDVNFGNGIRLLGGSLGINSREGKGAFFDELLLEVRGLGNDPYQFSSLRLQKNVWYRYDLLWRSNEFVNPALAIAGGEHALYTNRQMQDHDLTVLPQSKLRFRLGFSNNGQSGSGLSTGQWFDSRGDEFTYSTQIRRTQREYRMGGDFVLRKFKFSISRGWEIFKDDTRYGVPLASEGASAEDAVTLTSLRRDEPVRGTTPYWRAHLHSEVAAWFTIQARFTHSDGRRNFLFNEFAVGTDRFGADRSRQVLLSGTGRRPVSTGSLTLTWHPGSVFTLINQTAFHNTRMDGDGQYAEINGSLAALSLVSFQNLGIRTLSNATDASWQIRKWAGIFGNYQLSDRRVRSIEILDLAIPSNVAPTEQTNRQRAGTAGFRLQPIKPLRITLGAEVGRNDRPFYATSDKNYHALNARAQYRTARWNLTSGYQSFRNTNSTSLFLHSSTGRSWSASGGWTVAKNLQLDAGYSYMHWDALTGLAYFSNFSLVDQDRSYYVSNIHTLHAGAQWQLRKRADVYVGYVRTQDRGDGRATALSVPIQSQYLLTPATTATFAAAQVFPLSYQAPSARLSVILRPNLRWNVGWQYYAYREMLNAWQDYSAHTGFVSLSYSF